MSHSRFFTRFAAVGLLATSLCVAQNTQPSSNSTESAIIERSVTRMVVSEDGSYQTSIENVFRITSQAGVREYGLVTVPYAKAQSTITIDHVQVRKPDGTVIPTSDDIIEDMPSDVTRQAPEYSDLREKHIPIKGLAVGDLLEIAYHASIKPLVAGQFWYSQDFFREQIAKSIVVEIDMPATKKLLFRSPSLQPSIKEAGGRRVYSWSYDVKEIKKKAVDRTPPPDDLIVSTFQSWAEVGSWWRKLADEQSTPSPEVIAKAKSVSSKATSDEEKARAIYDYVSSHFRYIGISFGIGRYQPHPALTVFQNGYGDCKDKYALLAAMLRSQNINVSPALVNTLTKVDEDVPSPGQFNHVIGAATINGKLVWLDPTIETAPYGFLTFPERDRYALMVLEQGSKLQKTPATTAYPARSEFEAEGKLGEDGVYRGHFDLTFFGSNAVGYRAAYRAVAPSKWQELQQELSRRMGFGGTVSNLEVSGVDELDKPIHLSYDYERSNYSDWEALKTEPPMPPTGLAIREDPRDKSVPLPSQLEIGEPTEFIFKSTMRLPDGYTASLPHDVEVSSDFATYSSKSRLDNRMLSLERRGSTKISSLPQSRRDEFLKLTHSVYESEIAMVSLSSDNSPSTSERTTASEALFESARQQLGRGQMSDAKLTLTKLLKQSPNFLNAHTMLASILMSDRKQDEAEKELEAEIAANPTNITAYKFFDQLFWQRNDMKGRRDMWARAVKAIPDSIDARQSLAFSYMTLGQFQLGAQEFKRALDLNPDDGSIQERYADALVATGDNDGAVSILMKLAERTPTPDRLNSAAYHMAEVGRELPKAEDWARSAVKESETIAAGTSLEYISSDDLKNVRTLAADWDTLGWVYFKENKLQEAEKYLKAAWLLNPKEIIGAHLGQVYEKQGKRQLAFETYSLAASLIKESPFKDVPASPHPAKELLAKMTSSGSRRNFESAQSLQELRHTRLTLAPPRPESGEFYFLFGTAGKLEGAKYISGDEKLNRPEVISKITLAHFSGAVTPPGRPDIKIVRRGSVYCQGSSMPCEAILFGVDDVAPIAR